MENDVNAAVIGFASRNARDDAAIIYLYFPEHYPPGAGIFINGSLYKGRRNFAGEIANIPLGIHWTDAELYASFGLVCEAITKLIIAVCSVLNPDTVVLQGSFLKRKHINTALEKLREELPPSAVPKLLFSENFTDDFLSGMIVQTLATLEQGIVLAKN
jgi:predicted NBD/HSP70 family sugar kinase